MVSPPGDGVCWEFPGFFLNLSPASRIAPRGMTSQPPARRHGEPQEASEASSPLLGLTVREREVLQEMATGRNNATIAKTLFMSDRAVEKHIGSVFQKLGLIEEGEVNRRVMAVLAFLDATGPSR